MPISTTDIIEACNLLATQEHLDVCLTESLKGAAMAGFGAFALGALLGPGGMIIGATVGGIAGARYSKRYVPLVQIFSTMSDDDKNKLATHMLKVINKLDVTDALMLMSIVTNPEDLGRRALMGGLATYYNENWA